uniref:Uncharacterized protein n=1 Tax=Anguilla anguilla TaxID=7936 RepID=A0A0E9U9I1_ANGAN
MSFGKSGLQLTGNPKMGSAITQHCFL